MFDNVAVFRVLGGIAYKFKQITFRFKYPACLDYCGPFHVHKICESGNSHAFFRIRDRPVTGGKCCVLKSVKDMGLINHWFVRCELWPVMFEYFGYMKDFSEWVEKADCSCCTQVADAGRVEFPAALCRGHGCICLADT